MPAETTGPDAFGPGSGLAGESKRAVLATLRAAITEVANRELAGTDWTADNCPYIEYWFAYYAGRSAQEIEAALHKYAPTSTQATSTAAYVDAVAQRVRQAIARWRMTAEVDAPTIDVPAVAATLASLGPGVPLDSATRTRFESAIETDLSSTRVHADQRGAEAASAAGARAFAIGDHVAFGSHEYKPGTLIGDALLAHELAHTQQQDPARTASAGPGLEGHADDAAVGFLARLWRGAATSKPAPTPAGLQLQRCEAQEQYDSSELYGEEEDVGGVALTTEPLLTKRDGESFAVVGQSVKLGLKRPPAMGGDVPSLSNKWWYSHLDEYGVTTDRRKNNRWEVEFDEAGEWLIYVGVNIAGQVVVFKKSVTVAEPAALAKEGAEAQYDPASPLSREERGSAAYIRYRLALQERMDAMFGVSKDQSRHKAPYVESDAPNPMETGEKKVTYKLKNPPADAASYQWYRTASEPDKHPRYSGMGTRSWNELGEGQNQSVAFGEYDSPDTYHFSCNIFDKSGKAIGFASYSQSVLMGQDWQTAKNWQKFVSGIPAAGAKLKSKTQIPAAFVNGVTGEAMPLNIFAGPSAKNANEWIVLDLTPDAGSGNAPKSHEFTGSDVDKALDKFQSDAAKRYPRGRLHLMTSVLPDHAGKELAFSGGKESWTKELIDWLGLSSIGLTVAGFAFALFGAEPIAFAFFAAAAATGAAASAVSIAQRISSGNADPLGYFIDVIGLAVSVIGVGQARAGFQRAVAAAKAEGTQVLTAASGRKFVEWTEQKLVQGTAVLIGVESVLEIHKVSTDDSLTDDEKADRIAGLLKQIALQGGILSISSGRKLPPALKERTKQLAPLEQKVLVGLNDPALVTLETLPEQDLSRVAQLVAEHPVKVNDILAAGKVKNVAELEAELGAVMKKAPVPEPAAAPTPKVDEAPPAAKPVEPTTTVEPPPKVKEVPATAVEPPAKAADAVDPGGRGEWVLDEPGNLKTAERAELRELEAIPKPTEQQLDDLVALREQARGGPPAELVPGTPEHAQQRWKDYKASSGNAKWSFKRWMSTHKSRMDNPVRGVAREVPYRTKLGVWFKDVRSRVLPTPSGQSRQIDAMFKREGEKGRDMLQIKAGEESLGRTPRASGGKSRGSSSLSNADALAADAEFIAGGDRVTWIFEQLPTGPLVKRATELKVGVIIRAADKAAAERMVSLMKRAKMTDADIAKIEIVIESDLDKFVDQVINRYAPKGT